MASGSGAVRLEAPAGRLVGTLRRWAQLWGRKMGAFLGSILDPALGRDSGGNPQFGEDIAHEQEPYPKKQNQNQCRKYGMSSSVHARFLNSLIMLELPDCGARLPAWINLSESRKMACNLYFQPWLLLQS